MLEIPDADVLVVGGGLGGVAAAWAAAQAGAQVVLSEESTWLGGQLTTQATPPDEHPWIEQRGSTDAYRMLRRRVRSMYENAPPGFNPGRAWVTAIAHPPVVAAAALDILLLPNLLAGRLRVLRGARPVAVSTQDDRIEAVELVIGGEHVTCRGRYVLDATETGELLALGGVEHVTGSESARETGEPHAGAEARPDNVQAMTVPFALEHRAGEDHTIDRPAGFAHWRDFRLPGWPDRQLSWTAPDARTLRPRRFGLTFGATDAPAAGAPDEAVIDLWSYRRIVAPYGERDWPEVTIVNWPMNDYVGGHVLGDADQALSALDGARQLSLALLYWLQTEAPRPDGGTGYPGLRPRGDLLGSLDGLAQRPYLRESRRIRAEYTVNENDLSVAVRGDHGAASYPDSVGTGAYRIDLHPTTGGDPFVDIPTYPFEIPLRALVPVRVENLLPAAKNIGTTHIANGCYRLHPVEWTIGEASGRLAAYCARHSVTPRTVAHRPDHLEAVQAELVSNGFDLHWPAGTGSL